MSVAISRWERLKLLTFKIDERLKLRKLKGISLSRPDTHGVRFLLSAESIPEVSQLHDLVHELGLVSSSQDWMNRELEKSGSVTALDLKTTMSLITAIFRGDRFVEGLLIGSVNDGTVQRLCRHAYSLTLNTAGWPRHFPINSDGGVDVGIVVRSLDGRIEGRTTGGRRECPSHQCDGWLVGVHWQTGQRMHICSEGWHFDPIAQEVRVIGGGIISARFVSPKPYGTPPLPRSQWPKRADLLKSRAWAVSQV